MKSYFCKNCGQRFSESSNLTTEYCSHLTDVISSQKHEFVGGYSYLFENITVDYICQNYKWIDNHLQTSEYIKDTTEIGIIKERLIIIKNLAVELLRIRKLDYYEVQWTNNGVVSSCDDKTLYVSLSWSILMPLELLYNSICYQVKFASENKEFIKEKYKYIMETQSSDYEEQLHQISDLRWNPFIGRKYSKTQLLILGESFNWDGLDYRIDEEPDDPKNLIKSILFMPKSRNLIEDNFMFRVAKMLLNSETQSKFKIDEIWKSSAFMNLVQPSFKTGTKPKIDHFDRGWMVLLKVAELIQPKIIIKLGNRRINRLLKVLLKDNQGWNYDVKDFSRKPYIINLWKNNYNLKIICINHPTRSTNFDLYYWSKIIYKNSPELLQIFKKEYC